MRAKLTAKSIWTKKPEGGVIWDTTITGLHVRVSTRGRAYYCMTRVRGGRQIRPKIGEVGVIELADARRKARAIIDQADAGVDPKETARLAEREAKRKKFNTFASVADQFMAAPERAGLNPNTREQYMSLFETRLLPRFGDMPVSEIERADVREFFGEYGAEAPTAANRALFLLRGVLNFAVDEGAIDYNVSDRIRRYKEKPRDRWLEDFEIALLWRACERLAYPAGRIAQLLLLTGQRRLEVGHVRWSEINGDIWNLPASRTKTGVANDIPLAPLARQILDACPSFDGVDAVFTSGRKGDEPVSAWSPFKRSLDRAILNIQREDAVEQEVDPETIEPLERWTFHDLRRTCASVLQGLEISDRTIDRILNHRLPGERQVYNRNPLIEEKRRALQALADHVEAVISGTVPATNVVPIKAGNE